MRPNPQETADLVTLTEETLNMENFIFCAVNVELNWIKTFWRDEELS